MTNHKHHLKLKTRYRVWRARYSTPGLIARFDEKKVVAVVAMINAAVAVLIISILAYLTRLPLIFPAMGPSTFILFTAPLSRAAAPRNVILGHLSCLACGFVIWHTIGFITSNYPSPADLTWPLYISAALTLGLCCLILVRISCPHPPACGSGLVVALGAVTDWQNICLMAIVICFLTYQTVAMNRFFGVKTPLWSPIPDQIT